MYYSRTKEPSVLELSIWQNRTLLALVALHFAAVLGLCLAIGKPFHSTTGEKLAGLVQLQIPLFVLVLLIWRLFWGMICLRPQKPIAWFVNDIRGIVLDPARMLGGAVAFMAMIFFGSSFVVAKDLIPTVNPFSWDPAFAQLDRLLHGGVDPWRLYHAVLGTPFLTSAINAAYHFWFLLMYFLVFVACFNVTKSDTHRTFLIADVLTWTIGGNILAMIFSSVGPVYYQAYDFGDTFEPLMVNLRALNEISPVWALDVQEILLAEDGGAGISAMPSMHVASTVTMALYCFSHSRLLGWLVTGFAAIIMIGSVHLAWHYAVDGYFSVLLALAVWFSVRAVMRRFA